MSWISIASVHVQSSRNYNVVSSYKFTVFSNFTTNDDINSKTQLHFLFTDTWKYGKSNTHFNFVLYTGWFMSSDILIQHVSRILSVKQVMFLGRIYKADFVKRICTFKLLTAQKCILSATTTRNLFYDHIVNNNSWTKIRK